MNDWPRPFFACHQTPNQVVVNAPFVPALQCMHPKTYLKLGTKSMNATTNAQLLAYYHRFTAIIHDKLC